MSVDARWRKLFRDVVGYRGRALTLIAATSVGVFAVTAMLGAYGIVSREVPINYLETNPAHATIEMDEVTPQALSIARDFSGVTAAEARAVIEARAKVGEEWTRMLLFVVQDFDAMRLSTFSRVSGTWPPPEGSLLIERQAADFLHKIEGRLLTIRLPGGAAREVPIAGVVHDTTLAPAWQEQTGYGYVTRETLAGLGAPPIFDELRVRFADDPREAAVIDAKALALADALRAQGLRVHGIKVPPPGKHPHENLMQTGLRNFAILSALGLVLAAILTAAVLSGILARQLREIGIMKAIGARSGQIARMYTILLLALGGLSLLIGMPLGVGAAAARAGEMAETFNFTLTSRALPAWVTAFVVAMGLFMPPLISVPAIRRASRTTVREAIGNVGVASSFGTGRLDRALGRLRGIGVPYRLALRNTFRRRGRLTLALAMLATGGGLFMTALSLTDGWRAVAQHIKTDRLYDADFVLNQPTSVVRIADALRPVEGIRSVEVWGYREAALAPVGRGAVMRTYPDRGHGSFSLYGVPPETEMVKFPLLVGRWLQPGDTDAIVLTQRILRDAPGLTMGDRVSIAIDGRTNSWRLVGIAQEIGSGGGYVSDVGYAQATGSLGTGGDIRLIATGMRDQVVRAAERALDEAGISIARSMPLDRLYAAMMGHIEVPRRMLISAALLLVLLGGIGIASMMTMNVLERTREIGVMKAIGATPAMTLKIVAAEALFIAAAGWVLAFGVSLPLTRLIGLVGRGEMGTPLPFTVSLEAVSLWLGLVLVIAAMASAVPAVRAARLVVREALAYE